MPSLRWFIGLAVEADNDLESRQLITSLNEKLRSGAWLRGCRALAAQIFRTVEKGK